MKQKLSSVEWLANQIDEIIMELYPSERQLINDAIKQAKAMHSEETVDFGNDLIARNDTSYIGKPNLAEEYYNEIYGDQKQ